MTHRQTEETRTKIGKSVDKSAWRRKATDKSSEGGSSSNYDEDFRTPARERSHMPLLWEERT